MKIGLITHRVVFDLGFSSGFSHDENRTYHSQNGVHIRFSSVKLQLKTEPTKFIAKKTKKIEKIIRLFMIFSINPSFFCVFPYYFLIYNATSNNG